MKKLQCLLTIEEGISSFGGGGEIVPFIVSVLADLLINPTVLSPKGETFSLTGVLHNGEDFPFLLPKDSTEADDL